MVFSIIRFWGLGWIEAHFIDTRFTFSYFGFEWVQLPSPFLVYSLHIIMLLSALGILFGAFYRLSTILFFLTFSYFSLIDVSYYLNHYYLVSLVSFLLIFVPAHHHFSVDSWRNPSICSLQTPQWTILIFKLQIGIVYTYAGLAKINEDWLLRALPLKIWLPTHDNLSIFFELFGLDFTSYLLSWTGMIFDLTIVFWLMWHKSRPFAYLLVLVFHLLTWILFPIGVFPILMIGVTWIFFSDTFHQKILKKFYLLMPSLSNCNPIKKDAKRNDLIKVNNFLNYNYLIFNILVLFFFFQLLFPWRYLWYDGDLFWTEEGYRFSWRVMLMEKAGTAIFYVRDATGIETVVKNSDFLKPHQEKQMAMQADMILQFAHFLKKSYIKKGLNNPQIRAEVYVALNARPSQLLIDPTIDLTKIKDSWSPKKWILPLEKAR